MSDERKTFLVLMAIMVAVAVVIAGVSGAILYQTAFEQQRSRLVEVAQSQAGFLEAVARFDQVRSRDYPGGAAAATLSQITDAHSRYKGFGATGEFTLARRNGDLIEFVLSHRHFDRDQPKPVPFNASLAEPMRRALLGQSGTGIALDYRGVMVLAAYEPVAVLELGIVAKIDMAEIRAPFVRAAGVAAAIGLMFMLVAGLIFCRVGDPMVRRLVQSERDLRNVTDLTPVGILRSSPDGRITYVNDRWSKITGLPVDAALGEGWINSLHPEDRDPMIEAWRKFVDGEDENYQADCRIIRPDGSTAWLISQATRDYGANGELLGYVGSITDVTDLKQAQSALEQSENNLQIMTRLSPVGIFRLNSDAAHTYNNERWWQIMDRNPETNSADDWPQWLHPDDLAQVVSEWKEALKRDGVYAGEFRIVTADGGTRWILGQTRPELDQTGKRIGHVGSITDTTARKLVEQALRKSEERFSLAMRGANDGLWDWNLKTDEAYYSPRWSEMLGYESGELPDNSETWKGFLHPDDRPQAERFVTNYLEGSEKSYDVEFRLRHKDGHYVDISSRAIAVHGDDGAMVRVVGTNTDITRRKRAEAALLESEEKFRAITENTTEIIVIYDPDGFRKYVSPSAARKTRMKEEEIVGKNIGDLLHPQDADGFMKTLRRAWKHPDETIFLPEFRVIYPDGRTVLFEALFTGLPNVPGVDGIVVNARDITERKRAESNLLAAKEQAETANQAKSQFLSSMSHELRTPMNAILGFAQLLEQGAAGSQTENQKTFVAEILRSGHHMLELINDVLDLAKIESDDVSLDLEDQEPRPLIEGCLNMVAVSADQNRITVRGQFPEGDLPMVRVDALRLKQALLNLLSNAIKYNRTGGEVILETTSGADGILHISVSDTGPGIPDDMRDKVFEPFNRLGAESSNIPGTGIGLTVTKQVIEAMGGTVGFESTVGKGTTFWIDLPVARAGQPVS